MCLRETALESLRSHSWKLAAPLALGKGRKGKWSAGGSVESSVGARAASWAVEMVEKRAALMAVEMAVQLAETKGDDLGERKVDEKAVKMVALLVLSMVVVWVASTVDQMDETWVVLRVAS